MNNKRILKQIINTFLISILLILIGYVSLWILGQIFMIIESNAIIRLIIIIIVMRITIKEILTDTN